MRALYDEDYDEGAAPAVHFENVGVRYGMGPEVLRDLTFSIEPHSFQFLTGPLQPLVGRLRMAGRSCISTLKPHDSRN